MKSRTWSLALILALVAALPAFAQKGTASKAAPPAKPESSQAQVAGIVDRTVDSLWDITDTYWHAGDYQRIIGLCRVIVEADPSFNDAYASPAYLLWSLGDTAGADALLAYGVEKTSEKGELNFEYGRHLYTTKRYSDAETYLKRSIADPKAQANWYAMLGHTYRMEKKYAECVQTWQAVVEKFPRFVSGPPNLARAKRLQAGGK